jgi:hypothetical protein
MPLVRFRPGPLLAAFLLAALAACSTKPYPVGATDQPPWEFGASDAMPALDPPLSTRATRLSFCYAKPLNDEGEVLAVAEESCPGGRLVLESQDAFWNGCSLFQPMRATYVCDPPAETSQQP